MPSADGGAPDAGRVLTLHYRIALDDGSEVLSTFGGNPATLVLGQGELAPGLEDCLRRVGPGEHHVFLLEAAQAFGARRDDLVQTMRRTEFPPGVTAEPGAAVEFSAPGGEKFVGIVREVRAHEVVVDFNHPLAGAGVRFEVQLLSAL